MDYSKFENWKNSHSTEMQNLTFARPDDLFVYTRVTGHNPFAFEGKQVLYAESLQEVAGYIRHIFLYDILNDATDDLETDFKAPFDDRQEDAVLLLNYWFKLGKILSVNIFDEKLGEFINDFNLKFNHRDDIEYEIQIFNGADELRDFLIERYSKHKNFDKKRLCNICSKELFSGESLKDFLDMFFNNLCC